MSYCGFKWPGCARCILRLALVGALLAALLVAMSPVASGYGSGAPSMGPSFDWSVRVSDNRVELGESFDLTLRVRDLSESADHGGISVSFPDLTLRSDTDSSRYSSGQGSVRTVSYATGRSNVRYYDKGTSIYTGRDERAPAKYLLVESDDSTWPRNADRSLRLEVTPDRIGEFTIFARFWLCSDGYADCSRAPTGSQIDRYDQQYWGVREVHH